MTATQELSELLEAGHFNEPPRTVFDSELPVLLKYRNRLFFWRILLPDEGPPDRPDPTHVRDGVSLTLIVRGNALSEELTELNCQLDLVQEFLASQEMSSTLGGLYSKALSAPVECVICNYVVWVSNDPPGYGV